MAKKSEFTKRGQLKLRQLENGGETLYTQISLDDPKIIKAIEEKVLAGGSPAKIIADYIKRAFYAGYR